MKETRTINLNGIVFHIDNDAYRSLSDYLQDIELRLPQDERDDVMADVEARICELLQSALFAKNVQVVTIEMVDAVKGRIGAPSEFGEHKRPKIKHSSKSERSGCGRVAIIAMQVIFVLIAIQILLPVLAIVFAFCMAGLGLGFGAFGALPLFGIPFFDGNWGLALLTVFAALVAILLPVYALIKTIVSYMRTRKGPGGRFWLIASICWIISLGCFAVALTKQAVSLGGIQGITKTIKMLDEDSEPTDLVALPYFNAIKASGAMIIEVTQGEEQHVQVSAPDDLNIEVKDSVLCISGKEDIDGIFFAEITVPDLQSLTLSGASNASVEGTFHEVHYLVSGASKLDAENAPTEIVQVNCSGASKAVVNAEKELWAQASGASKIVYTGKPAIKRNMAIGASKIKHD